MKDMVELQLSVEYMKHKMIHALQSHHLDIEQKIKDACEKLLQSDQVNKIIEAEMANCIAEEMKSFWRYGDGNKAIQSAVAQMFKAKK